MWNQIQKEPYILLICFYFKHHLKVSFFKVFVFGYFVWKQKCNDNVKWTYFTHWQTFLLVSLFKDDLVQLLCSFSFLFFFAFFFLTWGKNSLCNPGWSGMKLTYYVVQAGFKLTAIFLSLIEGIIGICIMWFCVSVQISKAAFFSSNSIVLQFKSNNQKGFWSYFWFLLRKERSKMSEMRNVLYKGTKSVNRNHFPRVAKETKSSWRSEVN